jgi:hypothetical protein
MRRLLPLTLAALVAATGVVRSTTVIPPTFDELVSGAQSIFVGEAIGQRAYWQASPQGRSIKTSVTFRVEDVWKGQVGPITQLEFLGGTLDGLVMEVVGVPRFSTGQRDVLFVGETVRVASPLVGFMHGRMRIEREPASGIDRVRTFDGQSLVTTAQLGPARAPIPMGVAAMRLSDFKAQVLGRVAAGRAR